jgi:hypothetical protein
MGVEECWTGIVGYWSTGRFGWIVGVNDILSWPRSSIFKAHCRDTSLNGVTRVSIVADSVGFGPSWGEETIMNKAVGSEVRNFKITNSESSQ